ncbi:TrbI/VirB10 family protein [Ehrlichia japonica]|uniref:Bacterial conjugation TrbI-like family protein n=1 Tax=Ehrlichia japonica TaxID=391036 RepID=X5GJK9_9RICK|nr:TrbI/VirB10 family protein [Ehrlichia japonica]AHX04331.1 bacterial conjugation TrbI-like family protein [Ehrlichia japonica]
MSEEHQNNQYTEIEDSVNVVGVNRGKKFITIGVMIVGLGFAYYYFFTNKKSDDNLNKPQVIEEADIEKLLKESVPPTQEVSPPINIPPQLPELPPLVSPSLPSIPTVEKPKTLEVPKTKPKQSVETKPSKPLPKIPLPTQNKIDIVTPPIAHAPTGYDKERRTTSMLAISNGQNLTSSTTESAEGEPNINKTNSVISLQSTSSPNVVATKVNNLEFTILQGKIIDVVLETAINSDLQGTLRGIVARDVYAEANNTVMIPKGSRLIGTYSFNASPGKTRVQISWTRVILPNGIDIAIDSNGTDELGRQGASGTVDTKIGNILTSTILLAGVSIATSYATSKIPEINNNPILESDSKDKADQQDDDSTNKSKSTKTTLPVKILSQAVDDFSNSIKDIIKKYSNNNPTVYVDQGTLLKVFVNKDIIFPKSTVYGVDIVN